MVLSSNVSEQNYAWRWINDLPKAALNSSEDSSLKGLVCCQLLSRHWHSAALFAPNASWIWFEHPRAFGNRERRKSCHRLGGGCQFSWYGTHYIYAHKYWSAENSNLNLNLILKLQKKINSERRFTQVSLLIFSLKQNLKKQSELVSIIIPC